MPGVCVLNSTQTQCGEIRTLWLPERRATAILAASLSKRTLNCESKMTYKIGVT